MAPQPAPKKPPIRPLLVVILGVPAIIAIALWAAAWPAARTAPNDLPVGVAGPPAAVEPVAEQLGQQDGAFDVHTYEDEASAREAIEDREVYGALLVGGAAPELLTATAGGSVVAGLLEDMAAGMAPDGQAVTVTDVVPAPEDDPRGGVFSASLVPLALAGIGAGAMVTLLGLLRDRVLALLAIVGCSVVTGVVWAAIGHSWLEVLEGNWLAVTGAIAAMTLACGVVVAACAKWIGPPGIGVGAVIVMVLGNPWSGVATAPEMLPEPVALIGQWLPLGAGATLLRSVSFFDGAQAAQPLLALLLWTAIGVCAVALGKRPGNAQQPESSAPAGRAEPALSARG